MFSVISDKNWIFHIAQTTPYNAYAFQNEMLKGCSNAYDCLLLMMMLLLKTMSMAISNVHIFKKKESTTTILKLVVVNVTRMLLKCVCYCNHDDSYDDYQDVNDDVDVDGTRYCEDGFINGNYLKPILKFDKTPPALDYTPRAEYNSGLSWRMSKANSCLSVASSFDDRLRTLSLSNLNSFALKYSITAQNL
uniref:Uncharacterized protein n=1 Tax=Glossina palpalis gambiensis TaxID=67801 RepID=A0A1B0B840_9MUSC